MLVMAANWALAQIAYPKKGPLMSEFNNLTRATSFGAVVSSIPSDNWHYDLQKTHKVLGNLDD